MIRHRYLPFVFMAFMFLLLAIMILVGMAHADPVVVIPPNGQPTVIYPGNPTIAIGPRGGVTTIYPMGPPVTVLPVPVPLPPVFTVPGGGR